MEHVRNYPGTNTELNRKSSKKKSGKKLHFKVFLKRILFCALFVYFSCQLISQEFKFKKLDADHAAVDAQIKAAQKEQKNLNSELESIDSEDYLRRVIREKLGYTKPNEKVFVDASK